MYDPKGDEFAVKVITIICVCLFLIFNRCTLHTERMAKYRIDRQMEVQYGQDQ